MTPLTVPVEDWSRHKWLALVVVRSQARSATALKPPLAARAIPLATVVEPMTALAPVPHVVPVPSVRAMDWAAEVTRTTLQMWTLLVGVSRSVLLVWLTAMRLVHTVEGLGERATTREVSVVAALVL